MRDKLHGVMKEAQRHQGGAGVQGNDIDIMVRNTECRKFTKEYGKDKEMCGLTIAKA